MIPLLMGHSDEFTAEERRCLRKTRNSTIFKYDEFIDLVRHNIYNYK
jgi:hypothetical protein